MVGGERYPFPASARHREHLGRPDRPDTVVAPRTAALPSATDGREIRAAIFSAAVRGGAGQNRARDLTLAVWETALNAIEHGGGHPEVAISAGGDRVAALVVDRGPRCTPSAGSGVSGMSAPDVRAARGRGWPIIDALVDEVRIRADAAGTYVELTIRLPG